MFAPSPLRRLLRCAAMVCAVCAWATTGQAAERRLPFALKPLGVESLGVNIHFTDPRPGEMEMLAEAGFRWVRMDLAWSATEREKGQYDFRAYDRLLESLRPHRIKALLILDYSNPLYDNDLSPHSDAGRAAFAAWAAAAVKRFRGRDVLWEMYNEPNIRFWKPKPDVRQYIKLAQAVGKAIREVAPDEAYIGPATSGIDMTFLGECFKAGLLEDWCAVSVHPYRQKRPETVVPEYQKLRELIAKHAPAGKTVPIISGEWGYSAVWAKMDEARQGLYLPREMLVNIASDVPVSIWYDWRNDGTSKKDPEHHFGTVQHEYRGGQKPVFEPKPAYQAMKTLSAQLAGQPFRKRLDVGHEGVWVLAFRSKRQTRLAVWATEESRKVTIPASAGVFKVVGHTGEALPDLTADDKGLAITATEAVQYLTPVGNNAALMKALDEK